MAYTKIIPTTLDRSDKTMMMMTALTGLWGEDTSGTQSNVSLGRIGASFIYSGTKLINPSLNLKAMVIVCYVNGSTETRVLNINEEYETGSEISMAIIITQK